MVHALGLIIVPVLMDIMGIHVLSTIVLGFNTTQLPVPTGVIALILTPVCVKGIHMALIAPFCNVMEFSVMILLFAVVEEIV